VISSVKNQYHHLDLQQQNLLQMVRLRFNFFLQYEMKEHQNLHQLCLPHLSTPALELDLLNHQVLLQGEGL